MRLEEKLARWVEQPEDAEDDDDYGLIIDDSVTAPPPPALPKFTKAGSCSQLPSSTLPARSTQLGFLPANLHPLSAGNHLHRYVESPENENYDDLVLPSDQDDQLDKHLSAWKTPCRRLPSWHNQMAAEVTMSGATAVEGDVGRSAEESLTPTLGIAAVGGAISSPAVSASVRWGALTVVSPPATAAHAPLSLLSPARPKALPGVGLGLIEPGRLVPNGTPRQQRVTSSKQRHQNHNHNPNYSRGSGSSPQMGQSPQQQASQLAQQQQQQQRPGRRPMLIRNIQRPVEPLVVGCMRYDPVSHTWLGNEEEGARFANAIAESERQLRARGMIRNERPIDAGKLARKISQRSGNQNLVPALLLPEDIHVDGPAPDSPMSTTSSKMYWRCSSVAATSPGASSPAVISPLSSPRASVGGALLPVEHGMQGRPALIPPSAVLGVGPSGACGRARPIFDPQNLRWIDPNENQRDADDDPFRNISALPLEPPSVDAIRQKSRHRSATDCIGADADPTSCFALSEEQIENYLRESSEYESFARHWFPNPSSN
ncbi:hypothetical protein GGI21_002535 [Coemansia aciculifera]|uniref:Uncharacterized protein n=1 Tax=Coemansia aciculifera TaxID=417176 RepID=A0ACC1M3Z8_9FUNG|nr:hypothetical protein IWW38_002843 [Coemansia aciculifera]KAJ2908786.1 hypothetical protein GGI21_002535 [Coemansia aciculifera]